MGNNVQPPQTPVRIGDALLAKGLINDAQLQEALEIQKQEEGRRKLGEIILAKGWVKPIDFFDVLTAHFRKGRIGDLLVADGLITEAQLNEALEVQKKCGSRLGDIAISKGWIKPFQFYQALATHFERPFVDLRNQKADPGMLKEDEYLIYLENLFIPWRRENGMLQVAVADMSPETLTKIAATVQEPFDIFITAKFDIIWTLQSTGDLYFSEKSVNLLADRQPKYSAVQVFTMPQLVSLYIIASLAIFAIAYWPWPTLIAINAVITLFLLLNFGMRVILSWVGSDKSFDQLVTPEEVAALNERDLPVYTILVPMYKEAETLPILARSLHNIDYPISKLDIKLILEEDDEETIAKAKELGLEGVFEILRVPESQPRTKPKACNYALNFARGKYCTIYDGEDSPEPDQLKKAVIAFSKAESDVAVIQAQLNYFNVRENWLTRMFTMEYSLWFDFYLPALDKLRIPIPLGGTSNHFKMDVLRELMGWDPYNVTEDADLGVRMTQHRYRVSVVNSTTYEEANNNIPNWIRQRSRWLKGYMQTYLVHMRNPIELHGKLGAVGFWGFQFFIGGTILSILIAPLLYLMYFFWLVTQTYILDTIFPPSLLYITLVNLLLGNGILIYLYMIGIFKRHNYSLIPYALTVPIYWLMMSWAAFKGLWQLIHKPFYWEKTNHGLTTYEPTWHVGEGSEDIKAGARVK